MLDLGAVSAAAVPMLTRDPDLRSLPDAYESNVKLARWQIAQIRDGATGIVAESYQDLQVALTEALATYTKWQTYSDVPAAAKDSLRAYIDGIEAALEPSAPPAPPPGAMPPDPAMMGATPPMPPGPDMPMAPMPGGAL